jgi:HD-GYP domain-containing protein (c-di-GMP phosphodiesterase class II)
MHNANEKSFFESIRRSVKISYLIASVIPLLLLIYFTVKYVYPYITGGDISRFPIHIGIVLLLAVVISLLGLSLSTKATNSSLASLQNLYGRLNTLIETTKQLKETHYLDILLESIVKSAIHLNDTEAGSLLLYDEEGNLRYRVIEGAKSQLLKDKIVKQGEGVAGWVVKTGQTALINDVSKDKRYNPDIDRESNFKTTSILCVPLLHEKKIIGVLEVSNKKSGNFTPEDERLLMSLADQAAISIARTALIESKHGDIIHMTEILVTAQDFYLVEKQGHARRVAHYANLIGHQMNLSEHELKNLHYACLLHDIGFIKTGAHKLARNKDWDKEMYIMHPQVGYEMLKPISIWKKAAEIILNHHERYDGKGYPSGKKNGEIPLESRILSVAEVFDVLTSKQSYKSPIDQVNAIKEIEAHSGTQFDPEVVNAFKTSVRESDMLFE